MTLKEKLDAVWNDQRIACPSHLVRWTFKPLGWKFTCYFHTFSYSLYYTKGKLTFPKYFQLNKADRPRRLRKRDPDVRIERFGRLRAFIRR